MLRATTIVGIRHNGKVAIAGDGQVTMGESVIMKATAQKVRKLYNGKVLAGFAGSVADAFTLCEMFEHKLEEYNGNLKRAAVELAGNPARSDHQFDDGDFPALPMAS